MTIIFNSTIINLILIIALNNLRNIILLFVYLILIHILPYILNNDVNTFFFDIIY